MSQGSRTDAVETAEVRTPWLARFSKRYLIWLVLAVAVVGALIIGTRTPGPTNLSERVQEVASAYKCPACNGESAAVSADPTAVEMRDAIRGWLVQGQSLAQIRDHLVTSYGPAILERPPASGLDLLVWIVPVLAVLAAVAGLWIAFARWHRRAGKAPSEQDVALVQQALGADV